MWCVFMSRDLSYLAVALVMTVVGAYFGIKTKLRAPGGTGDPVGVVFALRLYVKVGGWVFSIGGFLLAALIVEEMYKGQ